MDDLEIVRLDPPGPHDATVIWLHGLGADGNDFVPAIPHLGLPEGHGVRFLFPTARAIPVTLNMGMVMPAWYDIRDMDLGAEDRNDSEGLARSVASVRAILDGELATSEIAPERVVVAGFSQGGAVAFELALTHPEPLAGLVALSTYIVDRERIAENRTGINQTLPIFQCHGTFDPMVPIAFGEAARDWLVDHDYVLRWGAYPMEHEVCLEELQHIGRFLQDALHLSASRD